MTGSCPGKEVLLKWSEGPPGSPERDQLNRHVEACADCRDFLLDLIEMKARFQDGFIPAWGPHCPPETTISAFVDEALAPDDRSRFEEHLAGCAACRQAIRDLVSDMDAENDDTPLSEEIRARAIAAGTRSPDRTARWPWMGAAAAAALLFVVAGGLRLISDRTRRDNSPPLRRGVDPVLRDRSDIEALSGVVPHRDQVVAPDSLVFEWKAAHPDQVDRYTVTVLDASGTVVWTGTTRESRLVLPREAGLVRGVSYAWYVTANRTFGGHETSVSIPFRIEPGSGQ